MPAPSTMLFEERNGARRRVELRGAGLPFRGVEYEGTQTVVTTWYPGNTVATQSVLGPREEPTRMVGYWNTTRLVSSPCLFWSGPGAAPVQVTRAATLVDIFDDLRRTGSLVRVVWSAGAGRRVVREGRVVSFAPSYDRIDDVRWTLTLDWRGRGESQRRVKVRGDDVQAGTAALIKAANEAIAAIEANKLVTTRKGGAKIADRFTLGDLEALADGPNRLMRDFARAANAVTNRVRHVGDLILKVRAIPLSLAGQVIDVATNAVAVSNQFVDAISRQPPELYSTKNKLSALTKSADYYGSAQTQAELMAEQSRRYEQQVRRRRSALSDGARAGDRSGAADMLAVHITRQGETLVDLSNRYYKTPDHATAIARANGLPIYQVAPRVGSVVVIPTLTAIEQMGAV